MHHFADGDLVDASKGAYDAAMRPDQDDMDTARAIRSIPSRLYEGARSLMGYGKDAGAGRGFVNPRTVAEIAKSVPQRKRGGRAK